MRNNEEKNIPVPQVGLHTLSSGLISFFDIEGIEIFHID